MRLFFAPEAEPTTALAIANWRDTNLMTDGRPVPAANFHITLSFVGELAHAKSERLLDSVDAWITGATPASGSLKRLAFPPGRAGLLAGARGNTELHLA